MKYTLRGPNHYRQSPLHTAKRMLIRVRGGKGGWLLNTLLLLFLLGLSACGGGGETPPSAGTTPTTVPPQSIKPPASADAAILDMIQNIQQNGFNNADAPGKRGLLINWRYGTNPLQFNLNDTGNPDTPDMPFRHDLLTDLRYVHALWIYKTLHPSDRQFDIEVQRYTAILKGEASGIENNDRGWVYDEEVSDLYNLSKDDFYKQLAQDQANYLFTSLYHPETGMIYKVDANNPRGFYRVDLALEAACSLIQAGITFNNPQWQEAGQKTIQHLYATAYVRDYHVFLNQLTNVLLPDGTLNPNPSIFRGVVSNDNIEGGQLRMGAAAQEILALLHVYSATKDQTYLKYATDLLDPLTSDPNTLGLWDQKYAGYYNALIFPGPDMQHLGTPKVSQGLKEAGRQLQMLEAFRLANTFTDNKYKAMQDALLDVALKKAYLPAGHGVPYEMAPNWTIYMLKNGKPVDWVTTEAMGIAIESLGSTLRSNPW